MNDAVEAFVEKLQTECGGTNIANKDISYYRFSTTYGPRYARIVQETLDNEGNPITYSRSVHAFVDLTTLDLLKADGWKKPAKGPRGNVGNIDAIKPDPYGSYLYARKG